MVVISIAFFYLYKIVKTYLIEYDIESRKEILEVKTYIKDFSIRIRKIESEINGLRDILTSVTTSRKEKIMGPPRKSVSKSIIKGEKKTYKEISLNKTEKEILKLLIKEGGLTSSQIRKRLGLSREHVARTLKKLYENKYVERDESEKPFKYVIPENRVEELRKIII
jgi:predicted HTH transcriptional regulator